MTKNTLSPAVCFLDESATDAKDSDHAVLGGLVINRKDIPEFDEAWHAMLERHRASRGLHMIELGPKGPHPHLIGDACAALLADAVNIINNTRIFTFGAAAGNREHEVLFSAAMRENHFSVYAMAFLMAVEINRATAVHQGYSANVDFVLDDGNRYRRQIEAMHTSIHTQAELAHFQVGSLEFRTDSEVLALQAADVVAWSTRRVNAGKGLKGVHAPLLGLFDNCYVNSPAPAEPIRLLAQDFARKERRGKGTQRVAVGARASGQRTAR